VFNRSILLGMSGAIHLHPHDFMAQTGTALHYRMLLVFITRYVADFGFVFNRIILLGMSGAIHLRPHAFMA